MLLFNLYGYRLLISALQKEAVAVVETKADKQAYADNELISVKTVLNLPYYTGSKEFERAYGSITINGKDYEYVKRRVYNDTLELLCLPNHDKTALKEAGNEMAKAAADGGTSDQKGGAVLKLSLPDFCQSLPSYSTAPSITSKKMHSSRNAGASLPGYANRHERPPQTA